MTNKEIEEAITQALLNGTGKLVPASELGLRDEDFVVDSNYLHEELYESYVAMCHSKDADDISGAYEKVTTDFEKGQFAVYGQRGMFKWFTLSAKYPKDVHKMTAEREKQNKFYSELQSDGGFSLGEHLLTAISSCDMFTKELRSIIVLDPSPLIDDFSMEDAINMSYLLIQSLEQTTPIHFVNDQKKFIDNSEIKGKDVILPFGYITENLLKSYPKLAKQIIDKYGANTVVAVGLARIVPSIDGKDGKLKRDDLLPLISPNPFLEVPRMFV